MDDNEQQLVESRARVFKAMAHPARMRIVSMLSSGSKNVGELTKAVGFDMSTVSKHLTILREAGVVLDETRGRSVYYSLYCTCIPEFIHCIDEIVQHKACPRTWHYVAVREPISLVEV
jgi:ArsR family transcriptional regulator